MRLFVAVDLDEPARQQVGRSLERLRQKVERAAPQCRIKWVEARHLHLTLRFLGEVDPERAETVRHVLAAPLGVPSFPVEVRGTGLFPPSGAPRVIWLAVTSGAAQLAALRDRVEARLEQAGFEPEGREFQAHLTVARVRPAPGRVSTVLRTALAHLDEGPSVRWTVDHVTLYESRLSPHGPEYSPLMVQPLGLEAP